MEESAEFSRSSQGRGVRPREVSPSNRGETSSNFEPGSFGVDRLSVSCRAYDFDPAASSWTGHQERFTQDGVRVAETFSRSVEVVPGVSAFVSVMRRFEQSVLSPVFAKVEFNPARVADPEGHSLASVADTVAGFALALDAASRVVDFVGGDDLSSFRLKRLDVARDFHDVFSPSALIRGLAPIPRPWSRKNLVHADPTRHGAQTLLVGSGAGEARLYDKFEETKGAVPPGTLRCEFEARSDWVAKYGGMATLADLDGGRVGELARNRWEWSAMGVEVKSVNAVVEAVARSGLSPREQCSFLGWLVMQSTDFGFSPAKEALAKYRKIQRELNVAFGADFVSSIGFSSRLDWDSGTVVTRVSSS